MKEARRVVVNDLMQRNYSYFLTEPMGKNFHVDFRPELTPKQMLALGVFGGKYMTDCTDAVSYTHLDVYKRQILRCAAGKLSLTNSSRTS